MNEYFWPGLLIGLLGSVIWIIAAIWFLVKMFQESVWWGIAGILCPILSQFIFLCKFWKDVQTPFVVYLIACCMIAGAQAIRTDSPEKHGVTKNENSFANIANHFGNSEDGSTSSNSGKFTWQDTPESLALEAAQKQRAQQNQVNFSYGQVLEIDPHTLKTSAQFQHYARGLQMKKDDLKLRGEAIDPADAKAVEELKKEVALFKQRYSEMKAAVAQFRAEQSAAAGNTAGE